MLRIRSVLFDRNQAAGKVRPGRICLHNDGYYHGRNKIEWAKGVNCVKAGGGRTLCTMYITSGRRTEVARFATGAI